MSGWRTVDTMLASGAAEVVVRLKADACSHTSKDDQVYWWGRSVHQIATIDVEGDIRVNNRRVDLSAIDAWMPIPEQTEP